MGWPRIWAAAHESERRAASSLGDFAQADTRHTTSIDHIGRVTDSGTYLSRSSHLVRRSPATGGVTGLLRIVLVRPTAVGQTAKNVLEASGTDVLELLVVSVSTMFVYATDANTSR